MTTDDLPDIGHNTDKGNQLKSIIDRINRLTDDKEAVADDIKDIYVEAKGNGFDTKTIRRVVRLHRMEKAKRDEEREMTELYLHAVGML